MCPFIQYSRKRWYEMGGLSNPKLFRRQRGNSWSYWGLK